MWVASAGGKAQESVAPFQMWTRLCAAAHVVPSDEQ
jgi:hypothetical protein